MGLYLEQTVKYINDILLPLGCVQITTSMVSNYVKKGLIQRPVKKQYNRDQIAYLIFVALGKNVISMENIATLFTLQAQSYDNETAYNYFCTELENMLLVVFGYKQQPDLVGVTVSNIKSMLRSTIVALAQIVYLNDAFEEIR